jgi:predicted MFS family arabinose efflux permease
LMATDAVPSFVAGSVLAFTLGWGWPGLFNLAVVDSNRETPGSATGVSQTGIYVGAGAGPAAFGVLYAQAGHEVAWLVVAAMTLLATAVMWLAARADAGIRAIQR